MASQESQEQSLNLTFGIELEFHVFGPRSAEKRCHKLVQNLAAVNIPSNVVYSEPSGYSRWHVTKDYHDLEPDEQRVLDTLAAKMSRSAMDHELYSQPAALELTSRKFFFRDQTASFEEISKALACVRAFESDSDAQPSKVMTNRQCGFHVHIGNDTSKIPFETCKRVFLMSLAFERCFDMLHAAHRIDTEGALNQPLSNAFTRAHGYEGPGSSNRLQDWLKNRARARDFDELLGDLEVEWKGVTWSLVEDGKKCLLHLGRVVENNERLRTMEFRQHAGTLDEQEIFMWVRLLSTFVTWCHDSAEPVVNNVISMFATNLSFGPLELLRKIGVDEDVRDFYRERMDAQYNVKLDERYRDSVAQAQQGPFGPLVEVVERNNKNAKMPEAVAERVREKLESGDYGLHPRPW